MSEHTPGPWQINKYGSVGAGDHGTDPIVCEVEPFYGPDLKHGNDGANARLIAAAPHLLAALRDAEAIMDVAALSGVKSVLAPQYQDDWARIHTDMVRLLDRLGELAGGEAG